MNLQYPKIVLEGKLLGERVRRVARMEDIYQKDIVLCKSLDDKKPIYFFAQHALKEEEWYQYIASCWKLDRIPPKSFKPLKRLLPNLVESFFQLSGSEKVIAIEAMRKNGILPNLKLLSPGTQPAHMEWCDVPSLCMTECISE